MGNRLAREIIKIAGKTESKGGLVPADERAPIPGTRGIGIQDLSDSSSGSGGTVGETLAPINPDPTSLTGEVNPQTDNITDSADTQSADDILDGALKVGDKLTEIDATDCASGKRMRIRTDGDEIGFPPPDAVTYLNSGGESVTMSIDWEEANIPPNKEGWEVGKAWKNGGPTADTNPDGRYQTAFASFEASISLFTSESPETFTGAYSITVVNILGNTYGINADLTRVDGNPPTGQSFVGTQTNCTPGTEIYCPISNPTEDAWPIDTIFNSFILTQEGGQFVTNQFDSDAPTKYTTPNGLVDFCNSAGDRNGRIEPTSNGGFMVSERNGAGGAVIGQYQVFNALNVLVDFVGEEVAVLLRPKPIITVHP